MPPRQPLRAKIREYLLEQILDGAYEPGDPIRELDVAARLEVSQAPVREALRELVSTGLVEYVPNRGTRVRRIDSTELEHYYPVRAALEGLAGEFAAPYLAGAAEPLYGRVDEMVEAAGRSAVLEFARASAGFHRTIVEAAHNRALFDAWQALGIEVLTAVSLATTAIPLIDAAAEHRPIADALAAGDGKRAGNLLRNHVGDYGIRAKRPARRPVSVSAGVKTGHGE
ncbi:GntR family transcriptional regulator [Rhodococcus sp. NPDC059968]|uniref:GntR family transcriptional regulator n=1 Tax=Rhodococcus sp. NPDC059968 TaxID=3347017 RepID=UPI00366AB58E